MYVHKWKTALTSPIKAAVIVQIVSIVIADLLLWVGEHSECFTHLLEFLFLLLLHLWSRCTVTVCKGKTRYNRDKKNNHLMWSHLYFVSM